MWIDPSDEMNPMELDMPNGDEEFEIIPLPDAEPDERDFELLEPERLPDGDNADSPDFEDLPAPDALDNATRARNAVQRAAWNRRINTGRTNRNLVIPVNRWDNRGTQSGP